MLKFYQASFILFLFNFTVRIMRGNRWNFLNNLLTQKQNCVRGRFWGWKFMIKMMRNIIKSCKNIFESRVKDAHGNFLLRITAQCLMFTFNLAHIFLCGLFLDTSGKIVVCILKKKKSHVRMCIMRIIYI